MPKYDILTFKPGLVCLLVLELQAAWETMHLFIPVW